MVEETASMKDKITKALEARDLGKNERLNAQETS
jgi:hypothetical protein